MRDVDDCTVGKHAKQMRKLWFDAVRPTGGSKEVHATRPWIRMKRIEAVEITPEGERRERKGPVAIVEINLHALVAVMAAQEVRPAVGIKVGD